MSATWNDLAQCLDHEAAAIRFWLRDDDAISDTPALRKLGAWAVTNKTEVLLAVVPSPAEDSLREALQDMPQLCACLHGWAHKNHAPPEQKKQELGVHRSVEIVCRELSDGWKKIRKSAPNNRLAVLVPPWNRISAEVVDRLPELGLKGISVFADAFATDTPKGLEVRNCHLDIIDWRGSRGGRKHGAMIEELIGHVEARAKIDPSIGVLGHHLVHDEAAWSFLDQLGAFVRQHPRTRWATPREIFSF